MSEPKVVILWDDDYECQSITNVLRGPADADLEALHEGYGRWRADVYRAGLKRGHRVPFQSYLDWLKDAGFSEIEVEHTTSDHY